MRVRHVTCGGCGGPKIHASPTAYVYCDWCGTLMDWDFRLAAGKDEKKLGPAFEKLFQERQKRIDALKRKKDLAELHSVYRFIYLRHMETCPTAYSPRVADGAYRERLADYFAGTLVLTETDSALAPLGKALTKAQQKLQASWGQAGFEAMLLGQIPKVTERAFLPFYKAWQAQTRAFLSRAGETGLLAKFPDQVVPAVFERMAASAFIQGWLPYLPDELANRLLREHGLEAQYVEVAEVPESERACAGCGRRQQVLEGARQVVCEGCGRLLGVAAGFSCPGCGAALCLPQGVTQQACPFCKGVVTAARTA